LSPEVKKVAATVRTSFRSYGRVASTEAGGIADTASTAAGATAGAAPPAAGGGQGVGGGGAAAGGATLADACRGPSLMSRATSGRSVMMPSTPQAIIRRTSSASVTTQGITAMPRA